MSSTFCPRNIWKYFLFIVNHTFSLFLIKLITLYNVIYWHLACNCYWQKSHFICLFVFGCFTISPSVFCLPPSLSHSLSLVPVKRTELLFQRSVSAYLCVMEVGRQLFSVSDTQTQTQLQTDLAALQEDWEQCQCMLGKRKTLTSDIIKVRLIDWIWIETFEWTNSCVLLHNSVAFTR